MSGIHRLLSPIVQVREEESTNLLLMFLYSFLAMTSYNIVKPLATAKFISDLGADNLPYVLLVAGVLIGVIMQLHSRVMGLLPRKWVIPVTQAGMVGLLLVFWALFQAGQGWASVGVYFFRLILGLLLISQFWILANDIYDPRQAKRLFGFIGGGASLGGLTASVLVTQSVERIGTNNLLLVSAVLLVGCMALVITILGRTRHAELKSITTAGEERGTSGREAIRMLRESRHLQIISLVIGFAAMGAFIIETQLNLAAEASVGRDATDSISRLLATVQLYTSAIGFVIQIWLTSRIHRYLGIGFALLMLPVSLGGSAVLMLLNGAVWTSMTARTLDTSLRYTVDKTTREILFLPLPTALKYQAKSFVDVTVDRMAKAVAGLIILVLIKPWGLGLDWQQLSFASLGMLSLWVFTAFRARQGYLAAFRRSIERQDMRPAEMREAVADLSTVETLVEELAHPDEPRVLYAIDVLESLDKRNLVTPLLLHHESPAVRVRALTALSAARPDIAEQWLPAIQRMVSDRSPDVRPAAVEALATLRNEDAAALARPLLDDPEPRIVATAAIVLAATGRSEDCAVAETALSQLASDTREASSPVRRDVAAAIRRIGDPGCRHLLIPLLYDQNPEVAEEAMRSVQAIGSADFLFVPTLVSLLRHRRLKAGARAALVSYGEAVLDALDLFLRDPGENIWVRRHLPATIARIPCQKSMDILVAALQERDRFLRFQVIAALEKLRREQAELTFDQAPMQALAIKEGLRYFSYLSLHHNLFIRANLSREALLGRALDEKLTRTLDRIYRLLGLLYPWKDIAAARWAIERGDPRARAAGVEYLDNILARDLKRRLLPIFEGPLEEKIRHGNVMLRTRPRGVEETLLELINDDDEIISAVAIDVVRQLSLWSLADDVEFVLDHRNAKDWFVFEAASRTLAARHTPEDPRRTRWLEPLPTVELVDRLRALPMFASVGVDELFRIAGSGRQARHDAGVSLFTEGIVPDAIQVLVDGKVATAARGVGAGEIEPPALLGFEGVLDGSPMRETIRTVEPSVLLTIRGEDGLTLVGDNTNLVQGLFRTIAELTGTARERAVVRGTAGADVARIATGGLTPIQKVLALQKVPVFSRVSAAEMLHLAAMAREVPLKEGELLSGEADPPVLCVVLSGELGLESLQASEQPLVAGPGDAVGIYEMLAGGESGAIGRDPLRLVVARAGTGLRIERDDLFDLLRQYPDLLQQLFASLFRTTGRTSATATAEV